MSVMIDGLKLKIPFILPPSGGEMRDKDNNLIIMSFQEFNGESAYTIYLENLAVNFWQQMKGSTEVFESIHKFESLPSSYSGLALKIVADPRCPCVWIFASPAKLMQGHNVFGSDNLFDCADTMFEVLHINYPKLFSYLDIKETEIQHVDVTASMKMKNKSELKQVLDFIGNIESGQTKQNNKNYQWTKYWGGVNSERKQLKIYAKGQEIDASLKHAKKTLPEDRFKSVAHAHTPEVRNYASLLLRYEARLKKKLLQDLEIPIKLTELIKLQENNRDIMNELWGRGFQDIMKSLEGQTMTVHNDEDVLKKLKIAYRTITKTGKESYSKAEKLYGFYLALKDRGYDQVYCNYARSTFGRLKRDLMAGAGLSQGYLMNLKSGAGSKVVPFVRYLEIDFENQAPEGWIPPKSNNVKYLQLAS